MTNTPPEALPALHVSWSEEEPDRFLVHQVDEQAVEPVGWLNIVEVDALIWRTATLWRIRFERGGRHCVD